MKTLPLTKGMVALVDDEDYERASQFKWYAFRDRHTWYAGRDGKRDKFGKQTRIPLHRFLLNPPPGMQVDHRNGDGLDCRRENIRICTPRQNRHNEGVRRSNTSGYKGVCFDKQRGLWIARIRVVGEYRWLGRFPTAIEAAQAYDAAALVAFGEFARPNFPQVEPEDWPCCPQCQAPLHRRWLPRDHSHDYRYSCVLHGDFGWTQELRAAGMAVPA